ncbi:hypothetical protein QJS04_geneDACA002695 [Acorus gramineus]|uniref:Exoribonuclease phosphorolytic domain-containing protein n=1 Tax=Acorus gramineus TaxID=55184 RepID=A0AAV9AQH2_ACOGR|nr:hypothetical protein QJS04_geneDACA002695 [Acorus gramineus]
MGEIIAKNHILEFFSRQLFQKKFLRTMCRKVSFGALVIVSSPVFFTTSDSTSYKTAIVNTKERNTIILAAVYGPKAGTRKGENPEKALIEVVWKPKTGQSGKSEKECELILRRTLQSICLLTVHPNTTTSVIVQLLPCAINASCAALVDAGFPLKHLAVGCGLSEGGSVILDPSKAEEEKFQAYTHLVFPNSSLSVLPEGLPRVEGKPVEDGIITSVTHGTMSVNDYLCCMERAQAASAKISEFLRRSLQSQLPNDPAKAS